MIKDKIRKIKESRLPCSDLFFELVNGCEKYKLAVPFLMTKKYRQYKKAIDKNSFLYLKDGKILFLYNPDLKRIEVEKDLFTRQFFDIYHFQIQDIKKDLLTCFIGNFNYDIKEIHEWGWFYWLNEQKLKKIK